MGATIDVVFDDQPVLDALERLAAIGGSAAQLMTTLGNALVDSTRLRFSTNIAPDGSTWAALNPAYNEMRRPGPILVQGGHLRGSITFRASAGEVMIGSRMIYAGVHQRGARIEAKNAKALVFQMGAGGGLVRVRAVTIPARPYLGISAEDEVMIIEETQAYLGRLMAA
jgi:phage virion morphogenesis protein